MKAVLALVWIISAIFAAGLNNAADNHMFCSKDSIWGGRANVNYMECNKTHFMIAFDIAFGPIPIISYFITYPYDHDGWSLAPGKPGQ